ncbi:hypothetical protein EV361DRAFT_933976 [Lentinula raphanica]|nr:hypothetical protein EV361DRAFT_933976 [Lentinula raphanica]
MLLITWIHRRKCLMHWRPGRALRVRLWADLLSSFFPLLLLPRLFSFLPSPYHGCIDIDINITLQFHHLLFSTHIGPSTH